MSAPIVAFVGHSESGKTGYLERLLPELRRRGLKVASVKHVPQHYHADNPQKDTERHLAAGALATVACARDAMVLTRPIEAAPELEDIGLMLGDEFDLIIAEGFKQSGVPKVEVWRQGIGMPLEGITSRVAVVTSDKYPGTTPRIFPLDDVTPMADFLENSYVLPQQQRVGLLINGQELKLSAFPREFITNMTQAMVASLKDVPVVKWLEIRLKYSDRKEIS
ncbi:MAG: molybdopterin-guanine dinucleotide biosynthesis protein B [Dehalogenimonas sp.]